ncbi:hypothetical protein H696_00637 [Fonticula alba]|uniref:Uncharacterized protein n=1 Tax=Fonticula alba TaxID=691883 RepID=A0A058ZHV7_FONAL|nr:hypothetical protein H696_00637 [Fonticula alba]KCV73092.1 hypothetical protein H696_00637 [Fonticula alba]|eukprot:XP_009492793.1 hypothetical protein H696_00637 [Fonticula alba]
MLRLPGLFLRSQPLRALERSTFVGLVARSKDEPRAVPARAYGTGRRRHGRAPSGSAATATAFGHFESEPDAQLSPFDESVPPPVSPFFGMGQPQVTHGRRRAGAHATPSVPPGTTFSQVASVGEDLFHQSMEIPQVNALLKQVKHPLVQETFSERDRITLRGNALGLLEVEEELRQAREMMLDSEGRSLPGRGDAFHRREAEFYYQDLQRQIQIPAERLAAIAETVSSELEELEKQRLSKCNNVPLPIMFDVPPNATAEELLGLLGLTPRKGGVVLPTECRGSFERFVFILAAQMERIHFRARQLVSLEQQVPVADRPKLHKQRAELATALREMDARMAPQLRELILDRQRRFEAGENPDLDEPEELSPEMLQRVARLTQMEGDSATMNPKLAVEAYLSLRAAVDAKRLSLPAAEARLLFPELSKAERLRFAYRDLMRYSRTDAGTLRPDECFPDLSTEQGQTEAFLDNLYDGLQMNGRTALNMLKAGGRQAEMEMSKLQNMTPAQIMRETMKERQEEHLAQLDEVMEVVSRPAPISLKSITGNPAAEAATATATADQESDAAFDSDDAFDPDAQPSVGSGIMSSLTSDLREDRPGPSARVEDLLQSVDDLTDVAQLERAIERMELSGAAAAERALLHGLRDIGHQAASVRDLISQMAAMDAEIRASNLDNVSARKMFSNPDSQDMNDILVRKLHLELQLNVAKKRLDSMVTDLEPALAASRSRLRARTDALVPAEGSISYNEQLLRDLPEDLRQVVRLLDDPDSSLDQVLAVLGQVSGDLGLGDQGGIDDTDAEDDNDDNWGFVPGEKRPAPGATGARASGVNASAAGGSSPPAEGADGVNSAEQISLHVDGFKDGQPEYSVVREVVDQKTGAVTSRDVEHVGSMPRLPHTPVLLPDVLHYLFPHPKGIYVDATFGAGGYTRGILAATGGQARVIGIDRDPSVFSPDMHNLEPDAPVILRAGRFSDLSMHLDTVLSGQYMAEFMGDAALTGVVGAESGLVDPVTVPDVLLAESPLYPFPATSIVTRTLHERRYPPVLESLLGSSMAGYHAPAPPMPLRVDGIVFDLGVSSMQLDQAERGFSFRSNGPLDMRMSAGQLPEQPSAHSGIRSMAMPPRSAADVVNDLPEAMISDIIFRYGEERYHRRIAKAIVEHRTTHGAIKDTFTLANIVRGAYPADARRQAFVDPATRTFQAIRIFVNDELRELLQALIHAESMLAPGGRLVVVSYHSLEDRVVKDFIRRCSAPRSVSTDPEMEMAQPSLTCLTNRVVTPSNEEVMMNPRSRSAKLRAAERTTNGPVAERLYRQLQEANLSHS